MLENFTFNDGRRRPQSSNADSRNVAKAASKSHKLKNFSQK